MRVTLIFAKTIRCIPLGIVVPFRLELSASQDGICSIEVRVYLLTILEQVDVIR